MSIENGITKLAEAIGALAQAGTSIAAGINRYCDMTQAEVVSAGGDAGMKDAINKAVAEFEAEHDAHKAEAEPKAAKAKQKKAEVVEEVTPVVEEAEVVEEVAEAVEEVAEAESDTPVTFEEAKTVVIDAVSTKGKPAVAAIFAKLGAKNLPELEPSQYSKLVALCKAA